MTHTTGGRNTKQGGGRATRGRGQSPPNRAGAAKQGRRQSKQQRSHTAHPNAETPDGR